MSVASQEDGVTGGHEAGSEPFKCGHEFYAVRRRLGTVILSNWLPAIAWAAIELYAAVATGGAEGNFRYGVGEAC